MWASYGMRALVKRRPRKRVGVATAAVFLLLALLVAVMVPGQVLGQAGPEARSGAGVQEATLRRSVPRDAETMVSSSTRFRYQGGAGQCSTSHIPVLELVTPPKHGTVRFVATDVGVPTGSGCGNSVYGQAVLYHPAPGFVGEDQFTYNVPSDPTARDWIRPPGLKTVIVTVHDQNTPAR
jgi:hypothetical protein